MKTMLYVILSFCLFTFACERKVLNQSSKVIVTLPNSDNSLQNILNPLSIVSTYSNNDNDEDEFNSYIMPSFSSLTPYPINCYMLGVGSENSEPVLSKNYCGKRSTINGKIDPNYKFGPFVGLFSSSASVELDVPSGERRIIYVFGIHAQNPAACMGLSAQDGQNPDASNFSRPYIVGKSATFTVVAGQTTVVPINLNSPGANDNIEGCVVPSLNMFEKNPANKLVIEKNSFPQNTLVTAFTGDVNPSDNRCDYVDVVPKFFDSSTTNEKFARVDAVKSLQLKMSNVLVDSYPTKFDCENNNFNVQIFPLKPTDRKVRRWLRLPSALNGSSTNIEIISVDGSLTPSSKSFDLISGEVGAETALYNGDHNVQSGFDVVMPDQIVQGQCYEMFVTRKSLESEIVTDASYTSPFNLNPVPAGAVDFFNSSGCSGGSVISPSIATNYYYKQIWFRANSSFDLEILPNGGAFVHHPIPSMKYHIKSVVSSSTTPKYVDVAADDTIRTGQLGAYSCYPIIFRFKNEDKAVITNTTLASTIEVLFNQFEGAWSNTLFYEDNICATTPITGGSAVVTFGAGVEYKKIYVKTSAGSAIGQAVARFKVFDGMKTYYPKLRFEFINANQP